MSAPLDVPSSSSGSRSSKPLSSPHRQRKNPPNAIPDKDLRFKIVIRVYGANGDFTFGHSYIVDDVPLGISSPIAEYYLGMCVHPALHFILLPFRSIPRLTSLNESNQTNTDATKYTFKELRHMLSYNTTIAGHMKKRSLIFQEGRIDSYNVH